MQDYHLESYLYPLPEELIAQEPPTERGASRLMVLERNGTSTPAHARFSQLCEFLPADALLIANNSRVLPARFACARPGGGKAEFLLLTPLPLIRANNGRAIVDGLIRPAAKIKIGARLECGQIAIRILAKGEFGQCQAQISWSGELSDSIQASGQLPLPPYIKREAREDDFERYQTIYASMPGSIAAPTAGLHFTSAMRLQMQAAGLEWREISLHVGYGTFSPVRSPDIRQHKMHSEFAIIDAETAAAIRNARAEGRPVIAVGTTSARALEGAFAQSGEIRAFSGMIDIFLYPGKTFNVIDGLITNFHLPGSSLLMLVAAFAGRQRILGAYAEAISQGYRFFSYGDAMLIRNQEKKND